MVVGFIRGDKFVTNFHKVYAQFDTKLYVSNPLDKNLASRPDGSASLPTCSTS